MARIVTVYTSRRQPFRLQDMSHIRWLKISAALARLGHRVDLATNEGWLFGRRKVVQLGENLRRVPLASVRWADYDVVKTLFDWGFETLERYGGAGHPFIISKLGSVVGPADEPGVYFYGAYRAQLFAIQQRLARASRYVTVLTRESEARWRASFPAPPPTLLVPGAVDAEVPGPRRDPYPAGHPRRCLFAGNFYNRVGQREAHEVLVAKMNALGRLLTGRGIRLFVLGLGDVRALDRKHVTPLGPVAYAESWDYLYFAGVGIVLAFGEHKNDNESTKIYHYLRAGLPVVCEAGFPNESLVTEAGLGYVSPNGDMGRMAELVAQAMDGRWDRSAAVGYVLRHHTWDRRAEIYHALLQ
jgi:hypothetical protein